MRNDLLHVIEAAQALDGHADEWMQMLTQTIGALLDHGYGAYGHFVDASDPQRLQLGRIFQHNGAPLQVRALESTNASLPADVVERTYRAPVAICSASERVGVKRWTALTSGHVTSSVNDFACVLALDTRGIGCAVGAPLDRVKRFSPKAKREWSRVTAHVVAMQRLRARLAVDAAAPRDGEAVLSPDARIEHAEGLAKEPSARALLREAAIARERARGGMRRRETDDALEMWQALVAGRWSIVDRFDHDGRRFLVAHENEPQAIGPRKLTAREKQVAMLAAMGHSNKLIAYELGLGAGSVAGYLRAAMRKLGLSSRIDVARVLRGAWMSDAR